MPRVSVILPTYNRAALLGRALDSVLAQEGVTFEVIVIDDGSTDATAEVVATYADPRLRYVRQENQGASAARNAGIRLAEGEYVAFLDSDDAFLPGKLRQQAACLDAHPEAGMVYTGYYRLSEDDPREETILPQYWGRVFEAFVLESRSATPTVMVRRAVLQAVGGFDETMEIGEDLDLWARIARQHAVEAIRAPLVRVWVRPGWNSRPAQTLVRSRLRSLDKLAGDLAWQARRQAYAHVYRQGALLGSQQGLARMSAGYALRALLWWPLTPDAWIILPLAALEALTGFQAYARLRRLKQG